MNLLDLDLAINFSDPVEISIDRAAPLLGKDLSIDIT